MSENLDAWSRVYTRTEDEKETEDLYKKVMSVLNKLRPHNFDTLVKQMKALKIETVEHLQGVINLIFEKAIDEPKFSAVYAKMCQQLSKINVNTGQEKRAVFKPILINRCQEEFEKQSKDEHRTSEKMTEIEKCEDPEKREELDFELEEIIRRLRMRSAGNIRFIGELFKTGMLTPNIMLSCLNKLLSNKDEDSLECLCILLSTIGKALEDGKDGKDLNKYFNIIQDIVDKKQPGCKVSSKIRFMLQDVIELRRSKWVPRRQYTNPKTIDQIAIEAENEQINQSLNNSSMNTRPKNDVPMSKGGVADGNKSRMPTEDGWAMSRTTPFVVQKEKLKFGDYRPFGVSHMFQTWSKGTQFKGGPSTNTTGLTNRANKYAVLEISTSADGAGPQQAEPVDEATPPETLRPAQIEETTNFELSKNKKSDGKLTISGGKEMNNKIGKPSIKASKISNSVMKTIERQLLKFFNKNTPIDEVKTWISNQLINGLDDRILLNALIKAKYRYSIIIDKKKFHKYDALFEGYLQDKQRYRSSCIDALHSLVNNLEHDLD